MITKKAKTKKQNEKPAAAKSGFEKKNKKVYTEVKLHGQQLKSEETKKMSTF